MKFIFTTYVCLASFLVPAQENTTKEATQWYEQTLNNVTTEQEVYRKTTDIPLPQSFKNYTIKSKSDADKLTKQLWSAYKQASKKLGKNQLIKPAQSLNKKEKILPQTLNLSGEEMPFFLITKGTKPKGGWPLFIATHGGGMDPYCSGKHGSQMNQREWQTQLSLAAQIYPNNAMYFIPRMPNDKHGRWWLGYGQDMYLNMIRQVILFQEVNPNRIYFIGISEGGYATYRVAPFFADKWAACGAMAAGDLPATCPAENLKVTPFFTAVGEQDNGFKRREFATIYHQYLTNLSAGDSKFYKNGLDIQAGKGHGIDYSSAPQWVYKQQRNPLPLEFQWINYDLDHRYRPGFFWLEAEPKDKIISYKASIKQAKNEIHLQIEEITRENQKAIYTPLEKSSVKILLNDKLVNLDKPVSIFINGKQVVTKKIERNISTILYSIAVKGDPSQVYTAQISITF